MSAFFKDSRIQEELAALVDAVESFVEMAEGRYRTCTDGQFGTLMKSPCGVELKRRIARARFYKLKGGGAQ